MPAAPTPNYAALDVPDVLMRLFHPRPESPTESSTSARELLIPAAPGVVLGARWYSADKEAPTLLFFHGNGEIVADYEELGPIYVRMGFNFFPVDYRGYGRSSGSPTVSSMMEDCRKIFAFAQEWLQKEGYTGPLVVMGRSLGSASASSPTPKARPCMRPAPQSRKPCSPCRAPTTTISCRWALKTT
jgi:alpha-beta hydrolase superfamily lysophospholipase